MLVQFVSSQTQPWVSQVNFQSPTAGAIYLGSPSLVKLTDGSILASNDYFGSGTASDETAIFKSTDNGQTWVLKKKINGVYWGTLFLHKGDAYVLGTSAGVTYRSIVIIKSTDGGTNWTSPENGVLFDKIGASNPTYHCAPTPVAVYNGRLYKGFERLVNASQSFRGYSAFAISIDENETDLLNPANWRKSTEVSYDTSSDQPNSVWNTGWIEGNIVEGPDGKLWDVMRVNSNPYVDKGAMIEIKDDGSTASFSAANFINLPGGMSKFAIRRDPVSKLYVLFTNNNTNPAFPEQRNVLSMYISSDLRKWHFAKTLMEDNLGLTEEQSIAKTGFQYPDFQFDGDDIIYLVRTAYDGANNFHNSNRITFGRVINFRQYLAEVQPVQTIGSIGRVTLTYNNRPEIYTTVRATDGNVWLQQNLGAGKLAESRTETDAYGDLFAWGRWDDGHQSRANELLSNTVLSPNNPIALNKMSTNPFYYSTPASNYFWSAGLQTDKLTGDLSQVNASTGCDPCAKLLGENWSLPQSSEWENIVIKEGITNYTTAYSSNLKIPSAGLRNVSNGLIGSAGTLARFWTRDAFSGGQAYIASFTNTAALTLPVSRGGGLSVRCIRLQRTLPVELVDFGAKSRDNFVELSWFVASQKNNDYYLLSRSSGDGDFSEIAKVKNIDSNQQYYYKDYKPFSGQNYYKLSQTDTDGAFKDLKTIAVSAGIKDMSVYVSKKGTIITFSLSHSTSKTAQLKFSNIDGKLVNTQTVNLDQSVANINIDAASFKGVYLATIYFDNGEVVSKKIIL